MNLDAIIKGQRIWTVEERWWPTVLRQMGFTLRVEGERLESEYLLEVRGDYQPGVITLPYNLYDAGIDKVHQFLEGMTYTTQRSKHGDYQIVLRQTD